MAFKRTLSGITAKFRFYDHPVVWVEGVTDVPFFAELLEGTDVLIQVAHGKTECQKLASAIKTRNRPFVVIMDGDYDVLNRSRSSHRRVVLLHRHSTENYLVEREVVLSLCRNYGADPAELAAIADDLDQLVAQVETELRSLLLLDVAHVRASTPQPALPEDVAALLDSGGCPISFSTAQLERCRLGCEPYLDHKELAALEPLLDSYTRDRRLIDLIPGHLALSILRRFLVCEFERRLGQRFHLSNYELRTMLSMKVWKLRPSADHHSLRERLNKAVREARRLREERKPVH